MKIAVIGQGYVGLTISVGALSAGHEVLGVDYSENLVSSLKSGKSHIEGISDGEISSGIQSGKFLPTSDYSLIAESDVVVIAVPTPLNEFGRPDLAMLESAAKSVGGALKKRALIINEINFLSRNFARCDSAIGGEKFATRSYVCDFT